MCGCAGGGRNGSGASYENIYGAISNPASGYYFQNRRRNTGENISTGNRPPVCALAREIAPLLKSLPRLVPVSLTFGRVVARSVVVFDDNYRALFPRVLFVCIFLRPRVSLSRARARNYELSCFSFPSFFSFSFFISSSRLAF